MLVSANGAWNSDSCSQAAKLFFIQKRKWLPSGSFLGYQQVATIRLGMDEDLIFHFILLHYLCSAYCVFNRSLEEMLNRFIILMGSVKNSAIVAWLD